jgi:hypothetical protein
MEIRKGHMGINESPPILITPYNSHFSRSKSTVATSNLMVTWKHTFQQLMVPYIRPEIFPNQLLPLLARHFRNPSASTDTTLSPP